jgi:hypothetical protein
MALGGFRDGNNKLAARKTGFSTSAPKDSIGDVNYTPCYIQIQKDYNSGREKKISQELIVLFPW